MSESVIEWGIKGLSLCGSPDTWFTGLPNIKCPSPKRDIIQPNTKES